MNAPVLAAEPAPAGAPPFRSAHFRWVVCALVFFAVANNYLDRQVFGVMGPELMKIFGWTAVQFTDIVFWFQVAYGIGFLLTGRIFDLIGTRIGFAIAVAVWSVAAILHAGMASLLSFKIVRFWLGLAEPANLPGSMKAIAEWFPRRERALATGFYKAGSNVGAMVVPLVVPWLFFSFGWRATFLITGSTGFIWLIFWLRYYRTPQESSDVTPEERAYILSDPIAAPGRVKWSTVLRQRETWAYLAFKFLTDSIWFWYGALFPLFLSQNFKLSLKEFGLPLIVIYLIADFGSVGGGWLSTHWIRRGWSITRARKVAMLICCLCTVPVIFVTQTHRLWLVISLVGLAHAAHQGLTSNLFTTVSDLFPKQAIGTVAGLGGAAGQIGTAIMTLLTGYLLATTGSFTALFFIAGSSYLVAWTIFHFAVPSLEPLQLEPAATT